MYRIHTDTTMYQSKVHSQECPIYCSGRVYFTLEAALIEAKRGINCVRFCNVCRPTGREGCACAESEKAVR